MRRDEEVPELEGVGIVWFIKKRIQISHIDTSHNNIGHCFWFGTQFVPKKEVAFKNNQLWLILTLYYPDTDKDAFWLFSVSPS